MTDVVSKITSNPISTRNDLVKLVEDFLDPLVPHFSPGKARVKIGQTGAGFDESAAEIEGFCRPLWALVPLLAGGGQYSQTKLWQEGLKNGPNPKHEEYWFSSTDRDQRFVEMASIGFALIFTPTVFWDPLSEKEKENLVTWLWDINTHEMPDNNWRWFRIMVNIGLRSVGARYDAEGIMSELNFIETFYDETGWATDGPRKTTVQTDYYSASFAIPFYSLAFSKFATKYPEYASFSQRYRERAEKIALQVVHLFSEGGNAIPFGRSMTYRFAMSAFWSAVIYADLELPAPLTPGVVKGLILRNIRFFTQKQSIFSSDGTLTIGYLYPNQFMAEGYNSPQSPYWCMKSLLILSLPSTHPFWSLAEEPYPPSLLNISPNPVRPLKMTFTHSFNRTFILHSGQFCKFPMRGSAQKYGKLGYSASFGFSVPTGSIGLEQHALDSTIGVCVDLFGDRWITRGGPRADVKDVVLSNDGSIKSTWSPLTDVTIITTLYPPTKGSGFYTREHRITSSIKLLIAEGGWAINDRHGPRQVKLGVMSDSRVSDRSIGLKVDLNSALIVSGAGASGIMIASSLPAVATEALVVATDPNTNLMCPTTSIPTLIYKIEGGEKEVVVRSNVFGVPFADDGPRKGWAEQWVHGVG